MRRTRVWVLLELEHGTNDADAEELVSKVLDNGALQDAINDRGQLVGPAVQVTAALSDLSPEPLQHWAEEHERIGSGLGG